MIYPKNLEIKLGFDKIRELTQKYCLSSLGKDLVHEVCFSDSFEEVSRMLHETNEFKQICLQENQFPLGRFVDLRPKLSKLKIEGTHLEVEDLYDFKQSLDAIAAILRFFRKTEQEKYPHLLQLTGNVKLYPYVFEKLQEILSKNGKIKDNASAELQQIRSTLEKKQLSVSKRMNLILGTAKREAWIDRDILPSMRDGRLVIPIPAAHKRKIKGIVHDESASGKTSYIEPAEIVETNNEIRELEYAERREITKILLQFSDRIRPYLDDLFFAYEFMAKIDFIRAKARLAIQIKALLPGMLEDSVFNWEEATHPLLFLTLLKENRRPVPLSLKISHDQRIVLISGPNAGGKSVCLQTVGLLQYMFQCGFLVPMKEESKMGIFEHIFIDIGDEQSIENDLSTYSSHLMNMKHFLRYSNPNSLILIDEYGTGTEPSLGGAIAESILEELNKKQLKGVITTHYSGLKHFASEASGIENAAMLYDSHQMRPLFQLQVGKPGSSFAFEIARKIGLPENILKSATDKLGEDHVNFDKHLRDVLRDKRYWENKREQVRRNEKKLSKLVEAYDKELKETSVLRKDIIEKARQEAEILLKNANKTIEKTIREIKENNARKEETLLARQAFEQHKSEINALNLAEEERIDRKRRELKNRQERNHEEKHGEFSKKSAVLHSKKQTRKQQNSNEIQKGDWVRLDNGEMVGEVIERNNNSILVAFGSMKTSVKVNRLSKVSKSQFKKKTRNENQNSAFLQEQISKRSLNFRRDIDVRGMRGDDAIQTLMNHLDEIIMLQVKEFRILHGTGHGILRQLIRDYLQSADLVREFRDEKIQQGGAGITVVVMD